MKPFWKNIIHSFRTMPAIFNSKEQLSFAFFDRLDCLIKTYSIYHYPERKYCTEPDFTNPIKVDLNMASVKKRACAAKKRFRALYSANVKDLEKVYNSLCDEYSKEVFLHTIVDNVFFGERVFRWPMYYTKFFLQKCKELRCSDEMFKLGDGSFFVHDLKDIGFNVKLVMRSDFLTSYVSRQYSYDNLIKIKKDDYVIDGGACFGDTAMMFADRVGENGKIFCFEPMEQNIQIFDMQLKLNPNLIHIISLCKDPLSDKSNEILYANDYAENAYFTQDKIADDSSEHRTISIDDFIDNNGIKKVDFIKLDLEGGELKTLYGAVKTIKCFKPQLAICAYHKPSDLYELPCFIRATVPEYKFYMDHHFSCRWETVLYATV